MSSDGNRANNPYELCRRIPYKDGLSILIWTCPFCHHRFWQYSSGLASVKRPVICTLCHETIWR